MDNELLIFGGYMKNLILCLVLTLSTLTSFAEETNLEMTIRLQLKEISLVKAELESLEEELDNVKLTRNIAIAVGVTAAAATYGGIKLGALQPLSSGGSIGGNLARGLETLIKIGTAATAVSAVGSGYIIILNNDQLDDLKDKIKLKKAMIKGLEETLNNY